MERLEIQTMIDLAIQRFHGENVARLTKIEDRIIGIDGNGTGRIGALQRQDLKLSELDGKLNILVTRSETWSKKGVWSVVKWGIPIIITLLALLLSYAGYRAANNKPLADVRVIHETIPDNASN